MAQHDCRCRAGLKPAPTNKRRSLRPNGTNKRQQVHTVGRGGFQTRPRAANAARRYDQIVSRGQVRRSKKIDHICRSTHYHPHRLRSGLPKRDGMRSSRNRDSLFLTPNSLTGVCLPENGKPTPLLATPGQEPGGPSAGRSSNPVRCRVRAER